MNNIIPADDELLELRQRTMAEIGALQAEIERLTEMKERMRADLRRLFEDCLAHLGGDACSHARAEKEPPCRPPSMVGDDMTGWRPAPCGRLLQGILTLARPRLAVAEGWDQVPTLVILVLIVLQQLVPAIQHMASLG